MITVNVSGLFPDGTTVGIYEGVRFDSGHLSPVGEPITQAVVGDGEVIFASLAEDGTTYTMAALIGEEWVAGYLTTSAPSGLTVVQLHAQVEDHEAETTGAHGGIVADTDPRLEGPREPLPHAASHKTGGGDPLTAADVGAATAADIAAEKAAREAADGLRQLTSEKGIANGYASLEAAGKVPVAQLPGAIMEYQGAWNANTNTPALADGAGSAGDVYRVSVAATRNLGSGAIEFAVGDYAIYNGTTWEKSDTTDAVASVAGKKGAVTLEVADVSGAEATANKDTDSGMAANSDVKYPSQKAVKTALALKQDVAAALPVFNVKAYGAKGDGVTGDSTAIQAAITAAEAVGGIVYFPGSTYIADATITVGANVRLAGDGWTTSIIKAKAELNAAVIESKNFGTTGSKNGAIEHLAIDGNKANNTAKKDGIRLASQNWYCRSVIVRNCIGAGFSNAILSETEKETAGLDNNYFSCRAINCEGWGFYIGAHDTLLMDCQAIQCKEYGIFWEANGYAINCHTWCYDSTLATATKTGWRLAGSVHCFDCIAEGATERQILIAGNVIGWHGGEVFNASSKPNAALFDFNGGTSARILDPWCHEFGTGGAFKFTTNGEASIIRARCFDTAGNQVTQGAPSDDIDWDLALGGATTPGEAAYFKRRQLTFKRFTPGTVPNNTVYVDNADGLLKLKDNVGTTRRVGTPSEEEIASAATITPSARITVAKVSGTTEITKITATYAGHVVAFRFLTNCTVKQGENLELSAARSFTAAEGNVLTLVCDGTKWWEISRQQSLNGGTVASANTITINNKAGLIKISGAAEVKKINPTHAGHICAFVTTETAKFVDGENLKLTATTAAGTADDAIMLVCDGTNWYQIAPLQAN